MGLGLFAAAVLSAEVTLTRLLSAGLFHHLAFVVVSTAMFGTAAGSLAIVLRPAWGRTDSSRWAGAASLAFAAALPTLYALSQAVPLEPLALGRDLGQVGWLALAYLLLALPFAVAGWTIALILDVFADRAPALYAADLAGASVGCFVALGALSLGPSGLYAASMLAIAAAIAFRGPSPAAIVMAATVALAAAIAPLPLHISASKTTTVGGEPFRDVLSDTRRTRRTSWGPLGRVDVVDFGRDYRRVVLDAGVATVRVPPRRPIPTTDTALPYELRPDARVLVIGAGAGWQVAEALQFGARRVDAVEINPSVAREAPVRFKRYPGVRWFIVDGRSFLHQPGDRYDVIVLIHTISNAATAVGALRLAEDYLLTVEALAAMKARLRDDGLLLLTRPKAQLPPLVWNLRHAGVPADRVWIWTQPPPAVGFYSAVMVKHGRPWTDPEAQAVRARLEAIGLHVLADPLQPDAQVDPRHTTTHERLRAVLTAPVEADSPPPPTAPHVDNDADHGSLPRLATDDRPYFHQHRRWLDWRFGDLIGQDGRARYALEDRPFAELSVLVLLAETTVMAAIVLLLPLALEPSRRRSESGRTAIYFSAIGLAFMLVEVSLVQRLGLLLGSPTLSFAVVFAGLLAGTALGSATSLRWPWPRRAPILSGVAVAGAALILPAVVRLALPGPGWLRIAIALITVFALGWSMGFPFPLGLKAVGHRPGGAAWAVAFNGVASVAGTALAILIGAQFGLTATFAIAVAAYALAALVGPGGSIRREPPEGLSNEA